MVMSQSSLPGPTVLLCTSVTQDLLFSVAAVAGNTVADIAQTAVFICDGNRQWVSESSLIIDQLSCEQIYCFSAPNIDNDKLVDSVADRVTVNTTLRYQCLDGYRRVGSDPALICTDDGTWTSPYFECVKFYCGRPPPVANATVMVRKGTAVYACESGHSLASDQWSRTCGSDGLWTNEFIECVPNGVKHCGDPPTVANASVQVHSAQLKAAALYTCDEGHDNFWVNVYECSETFGSWYGSPTILCLPVDCGDPPPVEHSEPHYTETTLGSKVVYHCTSSRVSPNGNTKTCTSQGTWSEEPPVECILSGTTTCGSPPQVTNRSRTYKGTVPGIFANYTCETGFTGEQFDALCGADGQWKFKDYTGCSPVDCGDVPSIEYSKVARVSGTSYGDVVVLHCLLGYTQTGPSLKTCEANQRWSADIVECVPESSVFCGDPPDRDRTIVMYESRVSGAEAWYRCSSGYEGFAAVSTCDPNGQWSEPEILCEPIRCGPVPILSHSMTVHFDGGSGSNVFGMIANVICMPGYVPMPRYPMATTCTHRVSVEK